MLTSTPPDCSAPLTSYLTCYLAVSRQLVDWLGSNQTVPVHFTGNAVTHRNPGITIRASMFRRLLREFAPIFLALALVVRAASVPATVRFENTEVIVWSAAKVEIKRGTQVWHVDTSDLVLLCYKIVNGIEIATPAVS